MKIGNRTFADHGKTYVMGILNVTPDSFSDGGKFTGMDEALYHVEEMIKDGMDLLDIGGESTHPGYTMIPDIVEINRLLPVLHAVKERFDIPISVDTYKAGVAQTVIAEGADLINDIWGLKHDPRMAEVIAEGNVPCCLMHNRETAQYQNFLREVLSDLEESMAIAEKAGIPKEHIILDPGIGFGKTTEQNLVLIKHMNQLEEFGCPMLLGTSRKSVIGNTLNLPVDEREEGTVATTVMAVLAGYSWVRVHNVKANRRAISMVESIMESDQ